jgi:hypothetical protein
MLKGLSAPRPPGQGQASTVRASLTKGLWLFCCYLSVSTNARVAGTEIPSTPTPLADTRRAGLSAVARASSGETGLIRRVRDAAKQDVHALSSFQRTKAPLASTACLHTDAHRCARSRHPGFPATGSEAAFRLSLSFRRRPLGEPYELTTKLPALSTPCDRPAEQVWRTVPRGEPGRRRPRPKTPHQSASSILRKCDQPVNPDGHRSTDTVEIVERAPSYATASTIRTSRRSRWPLRSTITLPSMA